MERRPARWLLAVGCWLLGVLLAAQVRTAQVGTPKVDLSKLPPPATNHIEFARDIKPIFERSCLRCHGPERPKSRFSLATRESALKGGNNGVDIIPGDSAGSPLIHYVAQLMEGMEMPPAGKGEPLTTAEVAVLRAWIDLGAIWEDQPPEPALALTMSPTLRWTTVRGDEHSFREHHWRREGWDGGAEEFRLSGNLGKDARVNLAGRALRDDYEVSLELKRHEVGFARFGWEQHRKYYDDTGGHFRDFHPSTFSLDRDLYLDIGRAWADFGLTLPDWPRLVIGYEYQYRDGDKSTLQLGSTTANGVTRNIYPSAKAVDERVHIIKFDADYEIAGVRIEDSFRGEFYDLQTQRAAARTFTPDSGSPSQLFKVREGYRYFQGANTFRLEKTLADWWLASAGHRYSRLKGDAALAQDVEFAPPAPMFFVPYDRWHIQQMDLDRESHVFNATTLLGPWQGFTLSIGVLNEWTRQTGFGRGQREFVTPFLTLTNPVTMAADTDTRIIEENIALRYTRIPYTVLFAEARLRQESAGLTEEQDGGIREFLRRTDATTDARDFRAGFKTSPWKRISLNARYRHRAKEVDYDHRLDQSVIAYPAFIRWRNADTDEVEAKLTWRPCAWLNTTLGYEYETTDYQTDTDPAGQGRSPGGRLESAESDAHRYSINATLTPWRRIYLSGTFLYQDTRLAAFANDVPSVIPYRGDLFSVLASATCAVTEKTDLRASYSFSWADYEQDHFTAGLPLGIRYHQHALTAGVRRRINRNVSAKLQYGFYHYDEPGRGGANDYTAHAVFTTLEVRMP